MRRKLPILFFLFLSCITVLKAQNTGDYESAGGGVTVDMGLATNWLKYNGTSWSTTGVVAPINISGITITIQSGDIWQNNTTATTLAATSTLVNASNHALGTFSTTNKLTWNGTFIYTGTGAQFIPPTGAMNTGAANNLTINNSSASTAGVSTTSGTLTIGGAVDLKAGQFNCNTGAGSFIFKGALTSEGGTISVAGNFKPSGTTAQVIPANTLVNNTINKLTTGSNALSSGGPIIISGGTNIIALGTGIFTLGGPLTITGISGETISTAGGSITAGSNLVTFNGAVAQTIPISFFTGNTINSLAVNNTAGVTSAGALTINTSLTATAISAITPLTVTGTATIGGNLTISGFSATPTAGQTYTILSATAISGTFAGGLTLPAGYTGNISYTSTAVKVTVYPSSNANLSSILLSTGTLVPVFDPATTTYTVSVPNATSTIKITPTTSDVTATIKVNGTTVVSGAASGAISLNVGNNAITTVVTAQDGTTTQTYTVNITRAALSTDATLSGLTLSNGTLSPVFASGANSYTASVANGISNITVTPTTNDATATVTVNGTVATSGTASAAIPLSVGGNTITTTVTAQDGTTTQTYTINLTRIPLSTDATLSGLALSTSTLAPAFASGTNSYTASVANAVSNITVTPTTNDATATVTVNGTTVTSGSASGTIALNVGNNAITTVVTAQDGTTTQTYTVNVTRAPVSTDATLSVITLSAGTLTPVFASATANYAASVGNTTNSITVTPTTNDANATVTVNGTVVTSGSASTAMALNVGANTITVTATAQDGTTTQIYTVIVTRAASADADLNNFVISNGVLNPVFSAATINYTTGVAGITSITVTPTVADNTATVTVNGIAVASGNPSGAIAINTGPNTITAIVTAQNGTQKTYTLTVTKTLSASTNANLSVLALSPGTLSPVFASTTTNYTASVSNATTSVAITPTTADATATVQVNGTTVNSGLASGAIPLNVGQNSITVIATAQDGSTTNTYTVVVTRVPSANANLGGISLSAGTLSPVFSTGTLSYTASVPNTTTALTLTPTTADATATVTVNGTTITSGAASGAVSLVVGPNTITTVVTAQDGTTKSTYTITVTRLPSSNTNLAALTLSSGTLSPAFAAGTTTYTALVTSGVTSVTVTPTLSDANASVKVNGTTVTNGSASAAQALSVGNNTISIVVTAQDGVTTNTYSIAVNRPGITQTITFAALNNESYGSADVTPAATSTNSTIGVTYTSSNTAVATISNVGAIHITGAGSTTITASQSGNSIYSAATPVQQILLVTPAVLTVTANNATKIYGSALPALPVAYTGFVNNETQSVLTTLATASTTATAASGVNTYAIAASGAVAANYTFNYVPGILTISPAPLTITANNATKVYGLALPVLTAAYTGFVNGDTFGSLSTLPTLTTTATVASPVNAYPVTANGAVSANYSISYVAGSLGVTPAPLSITANNATTTYGSAAPTFTATYTGFVNGDDATKLSTQPVLSTTYTAISGATTYPITASGAASGNYNISYIAGTLTVGKALLTITANNASKAYGSANPVLTVTYTGFLNGDGTAQLTTQPTISTTATTTSIAGTYPITTGGAAAANYSFAYVAGSLSVTAATRIFVFGIIPTHTYGDADFSPGATVNTGETIAYTTSDPNIATIVNGFIHIVNAGAVTVTASIASNTNYADVQPLNQSYIINKATQTISFNNLPVMQVGGPVLLVTLTSSIGLPVTLSSSQPAIASVTGQNISALSVGSTIITATQTGNNDYLPATYSQLLKVQDAVELVKVRSGLSPNGDGVNDYLVIEGIQDYPDNRLTIVNRNGTRIFQSSGYNNLTNVFDGHSSTNGELMQAGTYFYELEIKVNGETKRKAGYIILKFN